MSFVDTFLRRNPALWKWSLAVGVLGALVLGVLPVFLERYWVQESTDVEIQDQISDLPTSTPTPSPTPTDIPRPKISVERIMEVSYEDVPSQAEGVPQQHLRQILLGGDVMLGRAVGFNMTRLQDFEFPFASIGERMRQADATIVNLENPIIQNCPLTTDGMIFCSSPGTIETLQAAGVDMVNLANNHTLNYGVNGLEQTEGFLLEHDIAYTGTGTLGVIDVRGVKVGMLGYLQLGGHGDVLSEASLETLPEEVERAKEAVDILLVTFHWGAEYQSAPTFGQRMLALTAANAGADVIFAHHPHWVQGMEVYDNVPIFYSLGNLVFDQMWSKETREGLVVELDFYKDTLLEVEIHPVFMEEIYQPTWQARGRGNVLMGKVENLSESLMESQDQIVPLLK